MAKPLCTSTSDKMKKKQCSVVCGGLKCDEWWQIVPGTVEISNNDLVVYIIIYVVQNLTNSKNN